MRARFIPSYYARDLINMLQQLRQGAKSVEEYYHELQMGMLRCNLEEDEEPAMARFLGRLNHEIQDILNYKDYTNVTRLFHLACKAERQMQGQCASTRSNVSIEKSISWLQHTSNSMSGCVSFQPSQPLVATPSSSDKQREPSTNSASKTINQPAGSASLVVSTGRTKGVQCHRCKGYGHIISYKNSEPSPMTPRANESQSNAHDVKLTEGESSLDVLNVSTNHAMIE